MDSSSSVNTNLSVNPNQSGKTNQDRELLRQRLKQKLNQSKQSRGRKASRDDEDESTTTTQQTPPPPRAVSPTTVNMTFRRFPAWIMEQIPASVVQTIESFAVLVRFDLTTYPEVRAPEYQLGSRLDVMMLKLNGAVYYEASAHMLGLKHEVLTMGRGLEAHPSRIIEVLDRDTADLNHILRFHMSMENMRYLSDTDHPNGIPGEWVRERKSFRMLPSDPGIFVLRLSNPPPSEGVNIPTMPPPTTTTTNTTKE